MQAPPPGEPLRAWARSQAVLQLRKAADQREATRKRKRRATKAARRRNRRRS
jgi:hypothetical protein